MADQDFYTQYHHRCDHCTSASIVFGMATIRTNNNIVSRLSMMITVQYRYVLLLELSQWQWPRIRSRYWNDHLGVEYKMLLVNDDGTTGCCQG